MKPIIQKLWMFIAVLCASLSATAYDFWSDGLYYDILSKEERTVAVTYYSFNIYDNASYVRGDIELPKKLIYSSNTYTLTSIGEGAFKSCNGLTSVTIPNSVTSIGGSAFSRCIGLASVTIPNSVTYIGYHAFSDCSSLPFVTIPNSVTSIGEGAFKGCNGLTSVTIPNSVTSIGEGAFVGCSGLENIYVDPENTNYSSIDGILYSKDATSIIKVPATKNNVTIPNSVTSIVYGAFEGCRGLTSVAIPNSVTSIGDYAFEDCRGLTSMTIPNSVTSIGLRAFHSCKSLISVTRPNSVTYIGWGAFDNCYNLKSIYMQCEVPIECDPICSDGTLKEAILYVPKGTKTAYEKVDPWRNFWNIEEMDFSGVEGIEADEYGEPHISVNNGIVTIDGIDSNASIIVYDIWGRMVHNGISHTIDSLPSGLYVVKVGSNIIKISI